MESKTNAHRDGWNPPKLVDLSTERRSPAFVNVLTKEVSKQVANEHISVLRDPRKAFGTKDSPSSSPTLGNASDTYLRFLSRLSNSPHTSADISYSSAISSQQPHLNQKFARWVLQEEPNIPKLVQEELTKSSDEENIQELNSRFDELVKTCLNELQNEDLQSSKPKDGFDDGHDINENSQVEDMISPYQNYQKRKQEKFERFYEHSHTSDLKSDSSNRINLEKKKSIPQAYSKDVFARAVQCAARVQDRERAAVAARRKETERNRNLINSEDSYIKLTSIICSILVKSKIQGYEWREDSLSVNQRYHDTNKKSGEEVRFVGFLRNRIASRKGSERLVYDRIVARLIDEGIYGHFFSQPVGRQWTARDVIRDVGIIVERKMPLEADEQVSAIDITAYQIEEELEILPSYNRLSRDGLLNLIVEVTTKVQLEEWQEVSEQEKDDEKPKILFEIEREEKENGDSYESGFEGFNHQPTSPKCIKS